MGGNDQQPPEDLQRDGTSRPPPHPGHDQKIFHAVTVLVLGLAFYSEDPDGLGDAINIFLFPDLSLIASSKAELPARRWDNILGGSSLTSFSDTILLLAKQKVKPVTSREAA